MRQRKKEKIVDPELERKKKERETKLLIANQNEARRKNNVSRREPKFETKKIDYSKMQLVKVDRKISIYVDPKKSIRAQVEAFKISQYKKYFEN